MSTELREARDRIVNSDHPDRVLVYIENEMQNLRDQGVMFKLAYEDRWMLPILENYTEDLNLWKAFVKNVRDRIDTTTSKYFAVQEFYKLVSVRVLQRRKRTLEAAAVEMALRKGMIDSSVESRRRYTRRCSVEWHKRRDNMLKAHRSSSPTGRVSIDQRETLLTEFWDNIAEEIVKGEVPKP